MLSDSDLPAQNDVVLDHDAAREAGLRGDHYVFADLAVVADVDQVVNLRAPADARDFQSAPVDGGVGADLHMVFDFQASDLGEFFVASGGFVAHVTEAVAAENRARMDDHVVADSRAGIEGYVRI